ncbi:MAG: sulfatase-like hydrolase/transferase [Candidatus Moduliflexus flocculans]|nr:sulfatase-like hydrolase/transferase [Candidatus Moduliflexus flocculans]
MLTGRNHHRVGMGSDRRVRRRRSPGYTRTSARRAATALPKILKDNGYITGALRQVAHDARPRDRPRGPVRALAARLRLRLLLRLPRPGRPAQYDPSHRPGQLRSSACREGKDGKLYYLTDDIADKSDRVARTQSAPMTPDKPWFLYYCDRRDARAAPRRRRSGRTSTRASSTTAGTPTASATFERQKELGVDPARHAS